MKKHKFPKRMLAAGMSGIMLMTCAALPLTAVSAAENSGTLVNTDFNEGIGLPWHVVNSQPASTRFEISGGTYNIDIINGGGVEYGGEGRRDCLFRCEKLSLQKGVTYHLHAELTADQDGEIYTRIGHSDVYVDVWHNSMGATDKASGYEGSEAIETSWNCLPVKKDTPLVIDAEFTSSEDVADGVWEFEFGGTDQYQPVPCFPIGTRLVFDNMQLYEAGSEPGGSTNYSMVYDPHAIAVNQLGYFTDSEKTAVLHSDKPISAKSVFLMDAEKQTAVKELPLTPAAADTQTLDSDSGRYTYTIDFSAVTEAGTYYFSLDGKDSSDSYVFAVKDDVYNSVMKNALNYFYQNRCGMAIKSKYITSKGENESVDALAHAGYVHEDTGYVQNQWIKRSVGDKNAVNEKIGKITANGGWYEADTNTKSVINGAYSLWILQNLYEFKQQTGDAKRFDEESGEIVTPEEGNKIPDLLDECKYELDFLLSMMVPENADFYKNNPLSSKYNDEILNKNDSKKYGGMLFHSIEDSQYTGLAIRPWTYIDEPDYTGCKRIVTPPSTAATLSGAAVFAQGARLFREFDAEYAATLLNAAKTAYQAAKENPELLAPPLYYGTFDNINLDDEFFWAACELYAATGDQEYWDALNEKRDFENGLPTEGSNPAGLGFMTLALQGESLKAEASDLVTQSIQKAADSYLANEGKNGFGVPYVSTEFTYQDGSETLTSFMYGDNSNGIIVNNAILLAYAYQLTDLAKYRDGAVKAMNYIFGCNPLDKSYVTGCGDNAVKYPTHRYWANETDSSFPSAPDGVLVSGANSKFSDDFIAGTGMVRGKTAPQRCYVDDIEAWSVNSCGLDLNASLAWMTGFLSASEQVPIEKTGDLTGDLNLDSNVTISDAILLARVLAEDKTVSVTEEGMKNADMNGSGSPDSDDLTLILKQLAGTNK